MLDGRYPSDRFAELRPRLVWDPTAGTIRGRKGARQLAVTNAGTIPDRGLYGVHLPDGRRDRKSTRLNSSHLVISYAVFCLKKTTRPTHAFQPASSLFRTCQPPTVASTGPGAEPPMPSSGTLYFRRSQAARPPRLPCNKSGP